MAVRHSNENGKRKGRREGARVTESQMRTIIIIIIITMVKISNSKDNNNNNNYNINNNNIIIINSIYIYELIHTHLDNQNFNNIHIHIHTIIYSQYKKKILKIKIFIKSEIRYKRFINNKEKRIFYLKRFILSEKIP